jgi:hypothetical protein
MRKYRCIDTIPATLQLRTKHVRELCITTILGIWCTDDCRNWEYVVGSDLLRTHLLDLDLCRIECGGGGRTETRERVSDPPNTHVGTIH